MTHPHLEGLIRKWHERAEKAGLDARSNDDEGVPSDWDWAKSHYFGKCASELEAALAALPGGGVDEAMVERVGFAMERARRPEWDDDLFDIWWNRDPFFCEQKTAWHYFAGTRKEKVLWEARIALSALSPTPNPHEADQ